MGKYFSKKTIINGINFDSKAEAEYYLYLLEQNDIKKIELQPRFLLQEGFEKCGKKYRPIYYIADFRIINIDNEETIIDVKGKATTEAKIKRKMFDFRYPLLHLRWIKKYKNQWVDYDKK